MTSTPPLEQWPKWRDTLVYRLRMKSVPGNQIGDILLEIESHLRESGGSPEEVFGSARLYADARAAGLARPASTWAVMSTAVGAFAGTLLLVSGAIELGKGSGSILFLPPWLALLLGAILLTGTLVTLPIDLIRHPASDQPFSGNLPRIRWMFGALIAIAVVGFYFLGRIMA